MNIFGKKPKPKPKRDTKATVERMSKLVDQTVKKINFTEKEIDKLTKEAATRARRGDKTGAMRAIKLRQMKRNKLTRLTQQEMNLAGMLERVKEAKEMKSYVEVMHDTAVAAREMLGDVEHIEDQLDEVEEANEDFVEIERAIQGRDIVHVEGADEDELESQFAELMEGVATEDALGIPEAPSMPVTPVAEPTPEYTLPSAPSGAPIASTAGAGGAGAVAEDDDLAALEAEMGI